MPQTASPPPRTARHCFLAFVPVYGRTEIMDRADKYDWTEVIHWPDGSMLIVAGRERRPRLVEGGARLQAGITGAADV